MMIKTMALHMRYENFVHFFAVLSKSAMWHDQIQGFVENVSSCQYIFHSLSYLNTVPISSVPG